MCPRSRPVDPEPARLSLRRNFFWTVGGAVVYMICQWGILVVLTRLGSPGEVGQFALGLAIAAPVLMLTNLGLRRIQATDAKKQFRFGDYLGLRLLTNGAAFAFIATLTLWSGYRAQTAWVILALAVAKTVEAMSDAVYGFLQQHERMDRVARSMLLRGIVSFTLLTGVLVATGSLFWSVLAMAAGWAAILVLHDLPAAGAWNPDRRWDRASLAKLAWLALPLGFIMMLASLEYSIPSLIIEKRLGEASLGIFAALACFMAASNRVVTALGEAAGPRLARHHAEGNEAGFRRLAWSLLAIAAVVGGLGLLIAAVWGSRVLHLFYGAEYAKYERLFFCLMLAVTVANVQTVLQYAMTSSRRLRIQPVIFSAAVALNVVLCLRLVPRMGLEGAAWALLGVNLLEALASFLVMAPALLGFRRTRRPALAGGS